MRARGDVRDGGGGESDCSKMRLLGETEGKVTFKMGQVNGEGARKLG